MFTLFFDCLLIFLIFCHFVILILSFSMKMNVGRSELQTSILCIKFPPTFLIDEQQLHNALILFGEIEKIKTVLARNCSFVEFRSPKEALSAKEGLEGRLFNDPRIQIFFSSNELNPFMDDSPFFPGNRGPSVDMYCNEPPFVPGEAYAPNHLLGSNNFSGTYETYSIVKYSNVLIVL